MFDAERNRDLYRRLRSIIAPGGGLAIVSHLRERNPIAAMFAAQMLVWTNGGDAHSARDYERWLTEAGYQSTETRDVANSALSVVLAHRG